MLCNCCIFGIFWSTQKPSIHSLYIRITGSLYSLLLLHFIYTLLPIFSYPLLDAPFPPHLFPSLCLLILFSYFPVYSFLPPPTHLLPQVSPHLLSLPSRYSSSLSHSPCLSLSFFLTLSLLFYSNLPSCYSSLPPTYPAPTNPSHSLSSCQLSLFSFRFLRACCPSSLHLSSLSSSPCSPFSLLISLYFYLSNPLLVFSLFLLSFSYSLNPHLL